MTTTSLDYLLSRGARRGGRDASVAAAPFAKQSETPAARGSRTRTIHFSGSQGRELCKSPFPLLVLAVAAEHRTLELTTTPRARHPATFERRR